MMKTDIMKQDYVPITRRSRSDGSVDRGAVDDTSLCQISSTKFVPRDFAKDRCHSMIE